MPKAEEVDWLMRTAGETNPAVRQEIKNLVSYVAHMRTTQDKKPSLRSLERVVRAMKQYPGMAPVVLLNLKMGLALSGDGVQQGFNTALASKRFGQDIQTVWRQIKQVTAGAGALVMNLAMNLASGIGVQWEGPYDPKEWWKFGARPLSIQSRARYRRTVLEQVVRIVSGISMPLKAWYKLPGPLGGMKTWRCVWNTKDMIPRELNFVAEDLLEPKTEEGVLGVLYHELFELMYRHPEATSAEFLKKPGAELLDNGIGDLWINEIGSKEFPGARNWLLECYYEGYAPDIYGTIEEGRSVMEKSPLSSQFVYGCIYGWLYNNTAHPLITDDGVLRAIESLREKVQAVYMTTDVAEHKKLMEELYERPEFQTLLAREGQQGDGQQGEGQQGEGQQGDKTMPSLDSGAQHVDENGNALTPEQRKAASKVMNESIKKAEAEATRAAEEEELARMEEAARGAERKKAEREKEGITADEQGQYDVRYERVVRDISRMKMVFRRFYQQQKGYWERWRERGMLDDASIPLIVAGEDRVFKKRKEPKKYKVRISLLVDQSGSMGGYKISAVADTVLMMLESIKDDQKKGVLVEVAGCYDLTPGVKQDDPQAHYFEYGEKITKQRIIEVLSETKQTYGGNNDIKGIFWALRRIPKQESNTLNLVIHFSDGDPNFQFSRDLFRNMLAKRPDVMTVGLGIGPEADLVMDLYPKGQGAWAERTRDVPDKVGAILMKFIGRLGSNGMATTDRKGREDMLDMEMTVHGKPTGQANYAAAEGLRNAVLFGMVPLVVLGFLSVMMAGTGIAIPLALAIRGMGAVTVFLFGRAVAALLVESATGSPVISFRNGKVHFLPAAHEGDGLAGPALNAAVGFVGLIAIVHESVHQLLYWLGGPRRGWWHSESLAYGLEAAGLGMTVTLAMGGFGWVPFAVVYGSALIAVMAGQVNMHAVIRSAGSSVRWASFVGAGAHLARFSGLGKPASMVHRLAPELEGKHYVVYDADYGYTRGRVQSLTAAGVATIGIAALPAGYTGTAMTMSGNINEGGMGLGRIDVNGRFCDVVVERVGTGWVLMYHFIDGNNADESGTGAAVIGWLQGNNRAAGLLGMKSDGKGFAVDVIETRDVAGLGRNNQFSRSMVVYAGRPQVSDERFEKTFDGTIDPEASIETQLTGMDGYYQQKRIERFAKIDPGVFETVAASGLSRTEVLSRISVHAGAGIGTFVIDGMNNTDSAAVVTAIKKDKSLSEVKIFIRFAVSTAGESATIGTGAGDLVRAGAAGIVLDVVGQWEGRAEGVQSVRARMSLINPASALVVFGDALPALDGVTKGLRYAPGTAMPTGMNTSWIELIENSIPRAVDDGATVQAFEQIIGNTGVAMVGFNGALLQGLADELTGTAGWDVVGYIENLLTKRAQQKMIDPAVAYQSGRIAAYGIDVRELPVLNDSAIALLTATVKNYDATGDIGNVFAEGFINLSGLAGNYFGKRSRVAAVLANEPERLAQRHMAAGMARGLLERQRSLAVLGERYTLMPAAQQKMYGWSIVAVEMQSNKRISMPGDATTVEREQAYTAYTALQITADEQTRRALADNAGLSAPEWIAKLWGIVETAPAESRPAAIVELLMILDITADTRNPLINERLRKSAAIIAPSVIQSILSAA